MRYPAAFLLLLLAPVLLDGCRRKPDTAPQPSAVSESLPDRMPVAPDNSSLRLPVHQELTSAVHLYNTDHRKLPPDFETLVKERYLKAMPQPPPGKRFALDRNRLQVVVMD